MRENGQLIILTGFLMAIALAIVVILANNVLLSLNSPALMKPQERIRVSDIVEIINSEVKNALNYFASEGIDENNATIRLKAELQNLSRFLEYTYAQHGIALDVSFNVSETQVKRVYVVNSTKGSVIYLTKHEFQNGSILIPVDNNQWFLNDSDKSNDKLNARIFGLIYRILNDRNENSTKLDDVAIPVYRIIEDPRGPFYDNIGDPYGIPYNISVLAVKLVDGKNKTNVTSGSIKTLSLKGGPFLIDASDINETVKQWIMTEARNLEVDVYELRENLSYNWSVYIYGAPVLGVYPEKDKELITSYFIQAGLTDSEFKVLNNTQIERGALDSIDVLFTPHSDVSSAFNQSKNVTDTAAWKILNWVMNGGVYHVECYGVETVDLTIEKADGNLHPWYGFIGVNGDPNDYGKYYNATILPTIFTNNATLFVSQMYTENGELPPRGGHTPSFFFKSSHNPYAVPLANTTVGNAIVLAYAPFDYGHLVYMGGHNQSYSDAINAPTPERMMIVFNAIMLARTMKIVPVYEAKVVGNIHYLDGSTEFTKEINITIKGNYTVGLSGIPDQFIFGTSNLHLEFIQPLNGYIISGVYPVKVDSNASRVQLYLSGVFLGNMTYNSTSGYYEFPLNSTNYTPGGYTLTAAGFNGSQSVYSSVSITIKGTNSTGSNPGTGAGWEGELRVEVKDGGKTVKIKFRIWEDKNRNIPLSDALVNITIMDKDGNIIYSGISGLTDNDGKYEGEIRKDGDSAVWNFKKGNADYTSLTPTTWEFQNKKKYTVEVEVNYNGSSQYFTKEFEYRK